MVLAILTGVVQQISNYDDEYLSYLTKYSNANCMFAFISGNFTQLCEFIGKSGDTLAKNANHLDNVLGTFDIQQHSLGVLGIL